MIENVMAHMEARLCEWRQNANGCDAVFLGKQSLRMLSAIR